MKKQRAIEDLEYIKIYHLFYDRKYEQVIKRATKYLEKNPNNQHIRFFRANSYRILKEYDKAIEDLKYNINIDKTTKMYFKSCVELYYIYYNLNMYTQAFKLINVIKNNEKNFDAKDFKNFEVSQIVLKHKLGINLSRSKSNIYKSKYKYIQNQLKNYNEEEILKHIKMYSENKLEKTSFSSYIDIDYLYNYLRENLNKYKKCDINSGLDIYFFSIANIGIEYITNNICNFLKVLVIPETNNIITMYTTIDNIGEIITLNIDYDKLFKKNKEKVKTLSQIDKFNKRYSR